MSVYAHGLHTIRRRLLILAAVLGVPSLIASVLLLGYVYEREQLTAESELQSTARALSLVMDRQLGQSGAMLRTLATSAALAAGVFDEFDRQVREVSPGDGSWFSLRDMTGRQLVNTRLPQGAPLPPPVPVVDENTRAASPPPYVSNLVVNAPAGFPIVAIDYPVMKDGKMIYDLAMAVPAASFAGIFGDLRLPPAWASAVIDRKGVIVARSRNPETSVGHMVQPAFAERFAQFPEGVVRATSSLEGKKVLFAYDRSQRTGWVVGVTVLSETVGTAARRSAYLALAIGLAVFAGGALAARFVARGISRPIEELAAHAEALGRGEAVPAVSSGLAEVDLASEALRQAGQSLNELTATLEQRVIERTSDLRDANTRLSQEMEERRRAEEQLSRVQRMEAIGQLTGGVAHDFNNLLQAIIGNLDMLRRRATETASTRMIDNALVAAERGAKLTNQLLAFSRRQRLRPGPLDVNALVTGLVDILRGVLGSRIEIAIDRQPDLWSALADSTQLELMVLNLAINARDALPDAGKIGIRTANVVRGAAGKPEEPGPGDYVELAVTDNGTGMAPEILARVFEPFFTTKEIGKGSGLGLSQVLGLAQQQGGGVSIDSAPGEGTIVRIFMPRAPVEPAHPVEATV